MSEADGDQATDSDESTKFVDSLLEMKLHDTALDQRATDELAERCLAKFDDPDADLECRSVSLYTVIAQIRAGNRSMIAHVPDVCRRLKLHCLPTLSVVDDGAVNFHRQIVDAISAILDLSPERFVDKYFGPVMQYLVSLVSCENVEIAIVACKFWAQYAGMASNATVRRHWMDLLIPEMPSLIIDLIDQMRYRHAYAQHLQQIDSNFANSAGDNSLPSDVESFANLRNLAAVAFEHVARVYPVELVCATFRPMLEKRITSDSWSEKEAVILALAAFTQGAGIPAPMCSLYALVIPYVLDCYADPHPLLRSIACLTMPKLVGQRLRGVKDPWSRVLVCTSKATRDSCAEVRRTAIRALSALLAYGTPSGSTGKPSDVSAHTARLVDALVHATQFEMDPDTRCVYFECVSHLVGRASDSMTDDDMYRLMPPLLATWKSQTWNRRATDPDKTIDPDMGIVPFSAALGTIATYGKSLYVPFAAIVFEKACTDIKGCVFMLLISGIFSR